MMAVTFIGSKETVAAGLEELIKLTGINELMITTNIYDHEARLKSFQITSEVMKEMTGDLVC
jgi:alkanesulfonate monooxygenase SsuD/methylene tetrahydromethanopterin reductase-like flavin-dependent oxidoreductase (luciferase family)